MKKILVPTDFSTQAENALRVAAQLAKKHRCGIHLLHLIELPLQKVDPIIANNDLPEAIFFMKLASKHFETLLKKEYLKGITIYQHVEFNDIFKGVFHICEKNQIDLIIMGSKGSSGLSEMLIGSNTEKVVRTSEVPVLVIKKEHETFKIDNFVFASDFNDESKIPYTKATDFAKLFKAKIHLLMVNTPNKFMTTLEAEERMLNFTKHIDFKNFTINIYNDETIENGIMNYAKSINADLIGMSTHGRQGISHFFNGSISEDLVNHAKRPVMTFKI
ncbi:universal stress protein [Confluentibacter lentus]|uniref:universal stress protein n=1 Tax=Confluentibacter lentus TaxID=1699412 RepID=UPI000C292B59|nr:universal stress protein [Confluentibacter lentus]